MAHETYLLPEDREYAIERIRVIPSANSAGEAADEYDKYYSSEDQQSYGVLAIEVTRCS